MPSESSLSDLGLQMHCHLGLKGQVARAVNTGLFMGQLMGMGALNVPSPSRWPP